MDSLKARLGINEVVPELALVFNNAQRALKLGTMPALQREIAEFYECGQLTQFRLVDFVQTIERFSHTEQRWGL